VTGSLGLIHAVEKFDWRKGSSSDVRQTWWIRQPFQRGIATRVVIRLPCTRPTTGPLQKERPDSRPARRRHPRQLAAELDLPSGSRSSSDLAEPVSLETPVAKTARPSSEPREGPRASPVRVRGPAMLPARSKAPRVLTSEPTSSRCVSGSTAASPDARRVEQLVNLTVSRAQSRQRLAPRHLGGAWAREHCWPLSPRFLRYRPRMARVVTPKRVHPRVQALRPARNAASADRRLARVLGGVSRSATRFVLESRRTQVQDLLVAGGSSRRRPGKPVRRPAGSPSGSALGDAMSGSSPTFHRHAGRRAAWSVPRLRTMRSSTTRRSLRARRRRRGRARPRTGRGLGSASFRVRSGVRKMSARCSTTSFPEARRLPAAPAASKHPPCLRDPATIESADT